MNVYELEQERNEALDTIDDMINVIGEIIIGIASDNDDFVCTTCLRTASELYELMKKYARDEDAAAVNEQFAYITGRDIDD